MPAESELNDLVGETFESLQRDHTLGPIAREAVKDIRGTLMKFFFGEGERGAEPGTPLNPLFYDVVAARKSQGTAHGAGPNNKGNPMDASLPTPSQIIDQSQALPPDASQGVAIEAVVDRGTDAVFTSPSQVIDSPQAYLPEPQAVQELEHGREM